MNTVIELIRPDWQVSARVHACVTTRRGGVSAAPFESLNLASHVGDDPRAVAANRDSLECAAALPSAPIWLEQVHGTEVLDLSDRVRAADPSLATCADASLSRTPGVVCAVLTADCLPVFLCERRGRAVAVVHAGWRGLLAGVIERTLTRLAEPPAHVAAWLGPAIGPQAFEVGEEVRAAFLAADAGDRSAFVPAASGRWLADLYALARRRLEQAGVTAVSGGTACTYSDSRRFFSYRRDRRTGRMASLIWLDAEADID